MPLIPTLGRQRQAHKNHSDLNLKDTFKSQSEIRNGVLCDLKTNTLKKKLKQQHMLVRMWRKTNTPILLMELKTYTTTLKLNLAVSQKIGNSST